ncbi:hypothetical protein [Actinocorallia libanotica]|uniref:Uncharacterized protein n=1 Tax=Actinocorallia libanotica TaxID=46162 RepID=A0ABP4CC39_9ACTN
MSGEYYRRGHMVTGKNGRRFYRSGHWVRRNSGAAAGGGAVVILIIAVILVLGSGGSGPEEPREKPVVRTPAVPVPAVRTVTPGTTLAPDPGITDLPDVVIE